MKRVVIYICLIIFLVSSNAFAQQLGERLYKEVVVDGQKVNKWVEVGSISIYDEKGNKIHEEKSNSDEYWYEYDAKNNLIHEKIFSGHEWFEENWFEYGAKGSKIHEKRTKKYFPTNEERWYEYDNNGKLLSEKNSLNTTVKFFENDANGNIVHEYLSSNDYDCWYEYDNNGNLIHKKYDGYSMIGEEWYEYDAKGNKIYEKADNNFLGKIETKIEYNTKGELIHLKQTGEKQIFGGELWVEYEYGENEKIKKSIEYWTF